MKISVVTVAYNSIATINDTLASVQAQDWIDFEHIVIDGASLDGTVEWVKGRGQPWRHLISEPDLGVYHAMNKGLRLATGDVVGFLNSDDFFARKDALSLVARAFDDPKIDCVVGQTAVVARDEIRHVRRTYRGERFRPWMLRFGHMPPHPSFYARKSVLEKAGGFDTRLRISADFDLMVKLFLGEQSPTMIAIPETLVGFRDGGVSTKDLRAKLSINTEIALSLRRHGLLIHPMQLYLRYPFKAVQLLARPRDYQNGIADLGLPSLTLA